MNEKIGRNDPCSCGSGKKYKNCCFSKTSPSVKHKIKAKWLNAPSSPNLMDRAFGNAIASTGKTFDSITEKNVSTEAEEEKQDI